MRCDRCDGTGLALGEDYPPGEHRTSRYGPHRPCPDCHNGIRPCCDGEDVTDAHFAQIKKLVPQDQYKDADDVGHPGWRKCELKSDQSV